MLVTLPQALELLDRGELVAIPTETVYGLAADARNEQALSLLYQTKGRPDRHPVILHVNGLEMCRPYLSALPDTARLLMQAFWPGPLTLLLPKSDLVSPRITGGRPLVGVRAPATPLTLELLGRLGRPLVAPSANRFGHISPTTAAHVEDEFSGRIAVLDGGPCQVGLESTIVAIEPNRLLIMRPGQLAAERLCEVAGLPAFRPENVQGVPGALRSHYAPRQPLLLVTAERLRSHPARQAAVLALSEGRWPEAVMVRFLPRDADLYARQLYESLRQAEASACTQILVEQPPSGPDWQAVHDRLSRAAAR
jgi:L-threonylcarbamoyladenylate synthase